MVADTCLNLAAGLPVVVMHTEETNLIYISQPASQNFQIHDAAFKSQSVKVDDGGGTSQT